MCEPLLLANPYTNTLRPVRSRASTIAKEPARLDASLLLHVLVGLLLDLRSCRFGLRSHAFFGDFVLKWVGNVVRDAN